MLVHVLLILHNRNFLGLGDPHFRSWHTHLTLFHNYLYILLREGHVHVSPRLAVPKDATKFPQSIELIGNLFH
jgi:hypothetical protein